MDIEAIQPTLPRSAARPGSGPAPRDPGGDAFLALIDSLMQGTALSPEGAATEKPPTDMAEGLLAALMPGTGSLSPPPIHGLSLQAGMPQAGGLPLEAGEALGTALAGEAEGLEPLAGDAAPDGWPVPAELAGEEAGLEADLAELAEAARSKLTAGEKTAEAPVPAREARNPLPAAPRELSDWRTDGAERLAADPAAGQAGADAAAGDGPFPDGSGQPKAAPPATAQAQAPARPPAEALPPSAFEAAVEAQAGGDGEAGLGLRPIGEGASGTGQAGSASGSAAAHAAPAGRPALPHPASEMVSVHLARMAGSRMDRMTIQLRPAELGRVEVKLDFSRDGHVAATIVVDRPEAFDLLQRDARGLEKALQEAGLQTDGNSLNFSLRDQADRRQADNFAQAMAKMAGRPGDDAKDGDGNRAVTLLLDANAVAAPGRVDLRI